MSLLFEYAVDRFFFDNSPLYDVSEDALTTIETSVPYGQSRSSRSITTPYRILTGGESVFRFTDRPMRL
jgi:hypothetical protein